ncbi:MAG: lipopolysaccharide heptosyltransferase II [Verrucomicrobiia bacterium]
MKPLQKSAIVRGRQRRILVRATNWIGDSVMSMPAVQRLRELEPEAHIALLCPAKLQDLWQYNPFLSEVIPFDPKPSIRRLRQGEFDAAIVFPNSFRSAWECWCARIPVRVGFAGHRRRSLLTDVVAEPRSEDPVDKEITVAEKTFSVKYFPAIRHQAHRYLDIISYLGGNRDYVRPKIWIEPAAIPPLTKLLHEGVRPFFGIHAGAEYGPAKRWMPERFAEVAAKVSGKVPCRWLLFGGPNANDMQIANMIETQLRAHFSDPHDIVNVAGETTLLELCKLIKFCKLLLTNDTGPMHLASALGTPLVAVFGSTSAELTGPLSDRCIVVHQPVECTPCFLRECPIDFRCMDRITVDQVVEAALRQVRNA